MQKVYHLVAKGPGQCLDGIRTIHSKFVYLKRERAKAEIPAFTKVCTSMDGYLDAIDPEHIKVSIIEFDVVE